MPHKVWSPQSLCVILWLIYVFINSNVTDHGDGPVDSSLKISSRRPFEDAVTSEQVTRSLFCLITLILTGIFWGASIINSRAKIGWTVICNFPSGQWSQEIMLPQMECPLVGLLARSSGQIRLVCCECVKKGTSCRDDIKISIRLMDFHKVFDEPLCSLV